MQDNLIKHLREQTSFLTAVEVASLLGFNKNTIYQFSKSGYLPSVTLGSSLRFDPIELAGWIENQDYLKKSYCDRIALWTKEHLIEQSEPGIAPPRLSMVLKSFSYDWLTAARIAFRTRGECDDYFDDLRAALSETLTIPEFCEILVHIWSEAYNAPGVTHA